ncbi:uncharacterized protein EI90DRAFT_3030347 [Cantharellus anzutake]|uniref:uncharacterized protein n=1 Tax=Cantharellus anzutake TaxID=1750568 RepID=UPI001904734F|nr:uncharacterized protein EI90DRAFT_3030347 [Cantharellus anzutake]KAF8342816.1 hypothetical protein EI90DRAFT_3030347 [Cantharellus anzutake]
MAESMISRTISSAFSFASDRQILPNEVLTNILSELEPWDAWPLRLVCKNFDSYLLRVLAPRVYLPQTRIYIRRAESWVFYIPNPDYYTPPPSTADLPVNPTPVQPDHHRGQKFTFLNLHSRSAFSRVPEIAHYVPARDEEHDLILEKLEMEVQVIVLIKCRYYRQVRLPSLAVNRNTLTLSFDWKEMFCTTLPLPERIRRMQEMRPRVVWIPEPEEYLEDNFVKRVWMGTSKDSGSDMVEDSDMDDDVHSLDSSSSSSESEEGFDLGAVTPTPGSLLFAQMYGHTGVSESEDDDLEPRHSSEEPMYPADTRPSRPRRAGSFRRDDYPSLLGLVAGGDDREPDASDGEPSKSSVIRCETTPQASKATVAPRAGDGGATETSFDGDIDHEAEVLSHEAESMRPPLVGRGGSPRTQGDHSPSEDAGGKIVLEDRPLSSHLKQSPNVGVEEGLTALRKSLSAYAGMHAEALPAGRDEETSDRHNRVEPESFLDLHDSSSANQGSSPPLTRESRRSPEYHERGIQAGEKRTYQEKGVQIHPVQFVVSSATTFFRAIRRRLSWP